MYHWCNMVAFCTNLFKKRCGNRKFNTYFDIYFSFYNCNLFSMNMANWRLIIEGKNITHINWRGKATHYNFENNEK